jgi:signal transduction histidine kinase
VEEHLLRIGQEALINACRHSGAAQIHAELRYDADTVTLRIADDGVGFDLESAAADHDRHFGLTQMRERAAQAGGHVDVISAKGAGTQVVAAFPVRAAEAVSA